MLIYVLVFQVCCETKFSKEHLKSIWTEFLVLCSSRFVAAVESIEKSVYLLCYFDSPLSWGTNSTQGVESWLIHWVRNWFVTNPEGTNWTGQRVYFGNSYQMWSFCSLVGRKSTSSVHTFQRQGKEENGWRYCLLFALVFQSSPRTPFKQLKF